MRHFLVLAAFVLALPAGAVTPYWVTVGDPGNACAPRSQGCFGSVDYVYRIGKLEVTNTQYAEFLNAVATADPNGLYNTGMGSFPQGGITRSGSEGSFGYSVKPGFESKPVNYVSVYDAFRFANWLHNGQPTGAQDDTTTEDGAYTITQEGIDANSITRNAGATVFLASEDEWYKAAYFNGTGYFDYPAGADAQTACADPSAAPNTANCENWFLGLTDAGAYTGSPGPYGTFDQGGNVWEWTDTIVTDFSGTGRAIWGGGKGFAAYTLSGLIQNYSDPMDEYDSFGFRVATLAAECGDGADNDGDGFTDFLGADPGCADPDDPSENDPTLPCDDGADNDGDGAIDYPADIGCRNPSWSTENPECDDGIDNADDDDPPLADWDGAELGDPDPECTASWDRSEAPSSRPCGLGAELALLLPPLIWLHWMRRRSGP